MSDDVVVRFPGCTNLDLDPDRVLEEAKGKLETVLVIGLQPDGALYLAGSAADLALDMMLAKLAEREILAQFAAANGF